MSVTVRIRDLFKRSRFIPSLLILVFLFIASAAVLLLDYWYYYSRAYPRVMFENIDVGNMRLVDIEKLLAEKIWSTKHLSFTFGHQQIAPPVRHEYTDALPDGVREISRKRKAGHYITTWRLIYLNNREISREKLGRDFYAPVAALYRVGTGTE